MTFYASTFSFNGISCETYDLMIYDIDNKDNGQSDIASAVSIVEENMARKWKPFFYGTNIEGKLTFDFVFGVNECRLDQEDYLTRDEIDTIATWLTGHDEYMWLEFDNEEFSGIRYRCMITGLKIVSYGHVPFSFQATVTCDGPFAYRQPQEVTYQISGTRQISIENLSSLNGYYYPEIEFNLSSGTGFSITNTTDDSRTLSFSNMPAIVRRVYVNNETCVITNERDLNIYPYCNFRWLRFKRGTNNLTVTGYGTLKIKCEFPVNVGS